MTHTEISGSDLYRQMLAFNHDDPDRGKLMHDVWTPTPWMVNSFTGHDRHGGRERDMINWCYEHIGAESSPIHDKEGRWHRGNATVFGWTWFGFATEADMQAFMERWPPPDDAT